MTTHTLFFRSQSFIQLTSGLIISLSLVGCSITAKPQAIETFTEAGLDYTNTLRQVNQLSQKESLSFTAELLTDLPRETGVLETQSSEAKTRVQLIEQHNKQLDLLEQYFTVLNQFTDTKNKSKAEKLLADIVYALKDTFKVTRKQSEDFAAISIDLQSKTVLQAIIQRDRPFIAASLESLANNFAQQAEWLELRQTLIRERNYQRLVEAPFINNKDLGTTWKNAWIKSVTPSPTLEALRKAEQVSIALLDAWNNLQIDQNNPYDLQIKLDQLKNTLYSLEQQP